MWLIFGQLLVTIRPLFHLTSGHTGGERGRGVRGGQNEIVRQLKRDWKTKEREKWKKLEIGKSSVVGIFVLDFCSGIFRFEIGGTCHTCHSCHLDDAWRSSVEGDEGSHQPKEPAYL